jgi:hypothetical protein
MQAFPKDSRNMALGGAGPNNTNMDLNQFHGRGEEGYTDFSSVAFKKAAAVDFDPSAKTELIHGAESMGLGTSTFLEGAPASRAAIQRRQSENAAQMQANGGLQRKKSLAQKIRAINNRNTVHRVTSPEPVLENGAKTTLGEARSPNAKRPVSRNPFFQDYDDAYDKKGAKIEEAAEEAKAGDTAGSSRPRSTSAPKASPSLERRVTSDGIIGDSSKTTPIEEGKEPKETKPVASGGGIGGGLMNRVKSLRRPRPERKPAVPAK